MVSGGYLLVVSQVVVLHVHSVVNELVDGQTGVVLGQILAEQCVYVEGDESRVVGIDLVEEVCDGHVGCGTHVGTLVEEHDLTVLVGLGVVDGLDVLQVGVLELGDDLFEGLLGVGVVGLQESEVLVESDPVRMTASASMLPLE